MSETGTYFLSLHPNYQAEQDASEIGWAEYSLRPFTAFIYKLKNDVEIDLNKITYANWEEYVGDVFGNVLVMFGRCLDYVLGNVLGMFW